MTPDTTRNNDTIEDIIPELESDDHVKGSTISSNTLYHEHMTDLLHELLNDNFISSNLKLFDSDSDYQSSIKTKSPLKSAPAMIPKTKRPTKNTADTAADVLQNKERQDTTMNRSY